MTKRTVWHPQKSVTNDGSEEGGRGSLVLTEDSAQPVEVATKRKKSAIPRRRTPTVDVSVLVSHAKNRKKSNQSKEKTKARDTYNTIESHDTVSMLECSSEVYRRKAIVSNSTEEAQLCGWRDRELEFYKEAIYDRGTTLSSFDRSRLQTPAEGLRSNLHSRAGRRSAATSCRGRRNEPYIFQHFSEAHDYIEHYRTFHSYTTLSVPELRRKMIAEREVNERLHPDDPLSESTKVVGLGSDMTKQPDVKSYCEDESYQYLRELVSRLGVKALVQNGLKPTPPSINKKTKTDEALVVCSNGNTSKEEEAVENHELIPKGNDLLPNSPRPVTQSGGQSTTPGLPQIAQIAHIPTAPHVQKRGQSSNSVISIAKYLQVTSQQQQANLEKESSEGGERKEEVDKVSDSSQDCLPELKDSATISLTLSSDGHIAQEERQNSHNDTVEFNTSNTATMKLASQEQLMMLDRSQKEKLLSNKAHSLGLTSRDWARSSKAKRMLGEGCTAMATRRRKRRDVGKGKEEVTDHRQAEMSRPHTRADSHQAAMVSRPHTRMAMAAMDRTRAHAGSRMEESNGHYVHRSAQQANDVRGERSKRASEDHVQRISGKPNRSRTQEEQDTKKLEQLRGIYDRPSRRRSHRGLPSRCPTRQSSRCGNTRPSNHVTSTTTTTRPSTSSCKQRNTEQKGNHSRPVTQLGRSRGRGFVRQVINYEQPNLDESCCWNEIPRKSDSHTTETDSSAKPLDFELDDIMFKAKSRTQTGVAMVTVRLRNYTGHSRRSANDRIMAGATPQATVEHNARVNRRFDGVLNIQKPLATT